MRISFKKNQMALYVACSLNTLLTSVTELMLAFFSGSVYAKSKHTRLKRTCGFNWMIQKQCMYLGRLL